MRTWIGVLAFLAACTSGDDTGTLPADSGAGDNCGDTPPVIETLEIVDGGMSDPAESDVCGSEPTPRIRINVKAHDDDGDLHYWQMRVGWDAAVDGSVGTNAEVEGSIGNSCDVPDANLAMILCVTGDPALDSDLEFGAVILDDMGHESGAPQIALFHTPDAEGNYPEDTDVDTD